MLGVGIGIGVNRYRAGDSYPAVLDDGNTVGWYVLDEEYITKDGSDLVSQWSDKSGQDNHLKQATPAAQPLYQSSGILFDGIADFLVTDAFTLVQPEVVYIVFKQLSWTSTDRIFDGLTINKGSLYQTPSTPQLGMYAGNTAVGTDGNLALNTLGLVVAEFNIANSSLQIDDNTILTGSAGTSDMGGFTLGASGGGGLRYAHIEVVEIIVRKIIDVTNDRDAIKSYMDTKK